MSWGDPEEITTTILNNEVRLDEECWSCGGGKKPPCEIHEEDDGSCGYCNGIGFVPTEVGRAILELVKRHSKEK